MKTVDKANEVVDDKPQKISADLRKFNKTEEMVSKAVATLAVITAIATKDECDAALVTLKESKTVENKIEAKRKELVAPFNAAVKKINGHAKALTEKLPSEIDRVKKLVVSFQHEQEKKVIQQRYDDRVVKLAQAGFEKDGAWWLIDGEKAMMDDLVRNSDTESYNAFLSSRIEDINQQRMQRNENLQNDLIFGTDDVVETTPLQQITAPLPTTPAVVPEKVKGITKRWVFNVEDASIVPREYLVVDEKKIREAVNAGTRIIPGVRIYEDTSLTIR